MVFFVCRHLTQSELKVEFSIEISFSAVVFISSFFTWVLSFRNQFLLWRSRFVLLACSTSTPYSKANSRQEADNFFVPMVYTSSEFIWFCFRRVRKWIVVYSIRIPFVSDWLNFYLFSAFDFLTSYLYISSHKNLFLSSILLISKSSSIFPLLAFCNDCCVCYDFKFVLE